MADPAASAIALSLAMGAGAIAAKSVIGEAAKDAYRKVRDIISSRYSSVSIEKLEEAPSSQARLALVEEDLEITGAHKDPELARLAKELFQVIQSNENSVLIADLEKIEAANLILSDVVSTGGILAAKDAKFTGDILIQGARAGNPLASTDQKKT
ncbi:MAG: hypothetical protein AAF066_13850 [Pseudomonadota bacterium]